MNNTEMPDEIELGLFYAPAPMSEHFYSVIDRETKMTPVTSAKYVRADKAAPVGDIDAMVSAYEKERAQYVGGVVYYPNNEEAFRGAMRKALATQPKQSAPVERIEGLADALSMAKFIGLDNKDTPLAKAIKAARAYLALQGGE